MSDPELEAQLTAAWQKDRLTKKEKKQAREELRAQGLLGKHADPEDPANKYPAGMTLEDIRAEFRAFLISTDMRQAHPQLPN